MRDVPCWSVGETFGGKLRDPMDRLILAPVSHLTGF